MPFASPDRLARMPHRQGADGTPVRVAQYPRASHACKAAADQLFRRGSPIQGQGPAVGRTQTGRVRQTLAHTRAVRSPVPDSQSQSGAVRGRGGAGGPAGEEGVWMKPVVPTHNPAIGHEGNPRSLNRIIRHAPACVKKSSTIARTNLHLAGACGLRLTNRQTRRTMVVANRMHGARRASLRPRLSRHLPGSVCATDVPATHRASPAPASGRQRRAAQAVLVAARRSPACLRPSSRAARQGRRPTHFTSSQESSKVGSSRSRPRFSRSRRRRASSRSRLPP